MDWIKVVYSFIILGCGILIFVASTTKKGDERRDFITTKAQSYAFILILGMVILDVVESIYHTFQGNTSYNGNGISPLARLTTISIIYLVSFLFYRKRYSN